MVQNEKKFYLSQSISQEPYIIWFSFMVHVSKMIILQAFFSFFQNFDFPDCQWGGGDRGVKGQKIVQNDKKFC